MTKRLTLLIRANNKNSKRCMTARSAILVQCANGTLHTAELGFFPLQSRAHRLHEVIGTQHKIKPLWYNWFERLPCNAVVAGSNPAGFFFTF